MAVKLTPQFTIKVECSPHSKNASADIYLKRETTFKSPVEWWEVASIQSIWPMTSNEAVCQRYSEFYQDGVLITLTAADETKVAWIDSG